MKRRFRAWPYAVLLSALCAVFSASLPAGGGSAKSAFAGLEGEYRGVHEGVPLVVWVERIPVPGRKANAAALLVFKEKDRREIRERLEAFVKTPDVYYRRICARPERTEYGYHFPLFDRLWNSGGGLVRLRDGSGGKRLAPDWRQIKVGRLARRLSNEEHIVLHNQEYLIQRIRRDAGTGALESVQFSQTGYLQNWLDNPTVEVARTGEAPGQAGQGLLGAYLRSKDEAMKALGLGGVELSKGMPAVCG